MADSGPWFRDYPFLNMVLEADPDHYRSDTAYEFSGCRTFNDSDRSSSGIYDGA